MNNFEAGQVLEDAHNIGDHVLATLIVDPEACSPDLTDGYHIDYTCPVCGGYINTCTRAYCIRHDMMCYCFYCPDCWILFETIEIGHLDSEGDFHEQA